MDQRILEYVNQELKKGISKEEIVKALVNAGHKVEVIEQHFSHLKKRDILKYSFLAGIAIILVILVIYFYKPLNFASYSADLSEGEDLMGNVSDEIVKDMFNEAKEDFNKKNLSKAEDNFKDLIKIDSNKPKFHYYLAQVYCAKDKYPLAIEQYKKAISLSNQHPSYYFYMARCLEKQGLHQEAMEMLNKSLYVNLNISKTK